MAAMDFHKSTMARTGCVSLKCRLPSPVFDIEVTSLYFCILFRIVSEVERLRMSEGFQPNQRPDMLPYDKFAKFSNNYGIDFIDKTRSKE